LALYKLCSNQVGKELKDNNVLTASYVGQGKQSSSENGIMRTLDGSE
jgi:hypothetical protein